MKLIISTFLLFIISLPLLGQDKGESFWKKYIDENISELNLQNFEEANYEKAIRLWKPYQVIELIKINDSIYEGHLVNYVTKVNRKEKSRGVLS